MKKKIPKTIDPLTDTHRTLVSTQPLAEIQRLHLRSVFTLPSIPGILIPRKKRKLNFQELLADMTWDQILVGLEEAEKQSSTNVLPHVDTNVDPNVSENVDPNVPLPQPQRDPDVKTNVRTCVVVKLPEDPRAEDYLWDEHELYLEEAQETVSDIEDIFEFDL
eukprot:gene10981-12213_t